MTDDQDDDQMSREETRQKYGWASAGERQAACDEIDRRQRQIDAERILNEARAANARADERHRREAGVTKDYGAPFRQAPSPSPSAPTPTPAEVGEAWKRYVSTRIAAASQVSMRAIARGVVQTVGKDIIALEKRCAALEAELAELRAEAKLHATLDGIAERLDRLEVLPPKPSALRALPSMFDKGSLIA